ncbi:MAG: ABC transporter ATP-binding protein [Planctomycetales bacterium]|nr:ABC transporter ATP-binding protein [Planctomycetales bacterium]
MSATSEILRLDNLSKSFGSFHALRDVSLSVGFGVTGLLGPNGAGKSTLIKIVLGLLRASQGDGRVLGFELGRESRRIREKVGYMPEDDCYLPALSGVECVQFSARLCGFPALESLRRAHEILDFCGAGQERYRLVETYSTGMRQKLKFAQALVHDPPLLILDEPTAGLDPDERDAMLQRIAVLGRDHQKSVVLCTHILQDVQTVSDHVVILAEGRVRVSAPLEELSRPARPTLRVRTIGPPELLQQALAEQGRGVEVLPDGTLAVQADSVDDAQRLWEAAAASQSLIRTLEPARTSLEQIFLDAVQGAADGSE